MVQEFRECGAGNRKTCSFEICEGEPKYCRNREYDHSPEALTNLSAVTATDRKRIAIYLRRHWNFTVDGIYPEFPISSCLTEAAHHLRQAMSSLRPVADVNLVGQDGGPAPQGALAEHTVQHMLDHRLNLHQHLVHFTFRRPGEDGCELSNLLLVETVLSQIC